MSNIADNPGSYTDFTGYIKWDWSTECQVRNATFDILEKRKKYKDNVGVGIDSENRKSQEEFECIECGYKQNADFNASENIKQRLVSTVLRDELLKKNKLGNGTFEPKKLKREKVKEVLLSFRYNLEKDKETNPST